MIAEAAAGVRTEHDRGAPTASAFEMFAVLYMTAFVVDLMERWEDPLTNALFLAALIAVLATGVTRFGFLAFIVVSAGHVALVTFPDASNHSNLYLLCSPFIVSALLAPTHRSDGASDDERLVERLFPVLRVALSLTYICAGFHKLNADFLDPATSCAVGFFEGSRSAVGLGGFRLPSLVSVLVPIFVLAWELGGGILLWVPRFQGGVLLLCWVMHSVLAMKVFFDFSSMAFALMLAFVPSVHWSLLAARPAVRLGALHVRRLDLYVGANVLAGVAAGVFFWFHGYDKVFHKWQGLALNASFLVVVAPMISRGIGWAGVPIWGARPPSWSVALPVLLVAWALCPYLGLRTTGTFTMFSNLMTEGATSNHLLLRSNPLKIWSYQEDTVRILALDPRHARSPRHVLPGFLLPVVEFKKRLLRWEREGLTAMAGVFEYSGRRYETDDVVRNNPWRLEGRDLAMRLLGFRQIDDSGRAFKCRW